MTHVWAPDEEHVYIPAEVIKTKGNILALRTSSGGYLEVAKSKCIEILDPLVLTELCDDLVRLLEVNKPTILHTLRGRFGENMIYTSIGTILIAVNPFRLFSELYNTYTLKLYRDPFAESLTPHIFHTASKAFYNLMNFHVNQSMIISGESGSGKTEATKHCLKFFADISSGTIKGIEQKILSSSPILEAFGNAKTVRNDNSSRFGKWMDIRFNIDSSMLGCQITSYLLEKSRIVMQDAGERNFHIMYQIIVGYSTICQLAEGNLDSVRLQTSSESKKEIDQDDDDAVRKQQAAELRRKRIAAHPVPIELCRALATANFPVADRSGRPAAPDHFRYTCVSTQPLDDVEGFLDTLCGMDVMGFSREYIVQVLSVVCGVLHMGNIKFDPADGGEGSRVSTESDAVHQAASMFRIDSGALSTALCFRTISVPSSSNSKRMSFTKVPLRVTVAEDCRDALSKKIYENLFFNLVDKINVAIKAPDDASLAIGLLDIFGFEIFKTNSFEQLCINFANENLQQHFNHHIFTLETQLYKQEQVECHQVSFQDNRDVLDLVITLFKDLDEEGKLPKASSQTFFAKFRRKFNSVLGSNKNHRVSFPPGGDSLRIKHYAGLVDYVPALFMEKNLDAFYDDLRQTIMQSADPFIASLVHRDYGEASSSSSAGGRQTIAKAFRAQLTSLIDTLNNTSPHFVRCIKSNNLKQSMMFDSPKVEEQLRYSGVFEAVEIQQSGLPFRHKHDAFVIRYHCLVLYRDRNAGALSTAQLLQLIKQDFPAVKNVQIGRTMVFYTNIEHRILEKARRDVETRSAVRFQKTIRRFVMVNLHRQLMQAKKDVVKAKEDCNLDLANKCVEKIEHLQRRYLTFCQCIFSSSIIDNAMTSRAEIQERVEILNGLEVIAAPFRTNSSGSSISMEDLQDESSYVKLKELMDRACGIGLGQHDIVTELRNRYDSLRHAVESKKILQKAMSSASRTEIETAVNSLQKLVDRNIIPLEYCDRLLLIARERISVIVEEHETVLPKLTFLLSTGRTEMDPTTDELKSDQLEWQELEKYIDHVAGWRKLTTVECAEMLRTAYFVCKLRRSIANKQIGEARNYLDCVTTSRKVLTSLSSPSRSAQFARRHSMLGLHSLVDESVEDEFDDEDDGSNDDGIVAEIARLEQEIGSSEAELSLNSLASLRCVREVEALKALGKVDDQERLAVEQEEKSYLEAEALEANEEFDLDDHDIDFSSDDDDSVISKKQEQKAMKKKLKSARQQRIIEFDNRKSQQVQAIELLMDDMVSGSAAKVKIESNLSDLRDKLAAFTRQMSDADLRAELRSKKLNREYNLSDSFLQSTKSGQKFFLLPICHAEIRSISSYVSSYSTLLKFCNFVNNGRIPQRVPYVKSSDPTKTVNYSELEAFLTDPSMNAEFPASLSSWLAWADAIVQMRKYLDECDWAALENALESFENAITDQFDDIVSMATPVEGSIIQEPLSRVSFLALVKDESDRASRHLIHARFLVSLKEICSMDMLVDTSIDDEHLLDSDSEETLQHHESIIGASGGLDFREDSEFVSVQSAAVMITRLRSACNLSDAAALQILLDEFDAADGSVKLLIDEEVRCAARVCKCLKSVSSLKSALSLNGVKYNHGASRLSVDDTKISLLESALSFSDEAADWSKTVTWLSVAAGAIQDLRIELMKPQWSLTRVKALSRRLTLTGTICVDVASAPVDLSESSTRPTLNKSSSYLCPICPNECLKELVDIRFEVELREIGDAVSSILKQARVSGTVGAIVLSSTPQEKMLLDVEARLFDVVNKYEACNQRCLSLQSSDSVIEHTSISPSSVTRLEACKLMVCVRNAAKESDWEQVKVYTELFDASFDGQDSFTKDIELHPKRKDKFAESKISGKSLLSEQSTHASIWKTRIKAGFSLPSEATNELKLLSLEVRHIALIKQLRLAVTSGCVIGSVGRLSLEAMTLDDLVCGLKNAADIGCHNTECQLLHDIATSLVSMRTLLQSSSTSSARLLDGDNLKRTMNVQKSLGLGTDEIELLYNQKLNLHVLDNFLSWLSSPGSLDIIDIAFASYDLLSVAASDLKSLAQLCRAVRRLRKASQQGIREDIHSLAVTVRQCLGVAPMLQLGKADQFQFSGCFIQEVASPNQARLSLDIEVEHAMAVVQTSCLIDMLKSGIQLGPITRLDCSLESVPKNGYQDYLGVVDQLLTSGVENTFKLICQTVEKARAWRSSVVVSSAIQTVTSTSPLGLCSQALQYMDEFVVFISNGGSVQDDAKLDNLSVVARRSRKLLADELVSLFRDSCISAELRAVLKPNSRMETESIWLTFQHVLLNVITIGVLPSLKHNVVLKEFTIVLSEIVFRKLTGLLTTHNSSCILHPSVKLAPDNSIGFIDVDCSCVKFSEAVDLIKTCDHLLSPYSSLSDFLQVLYGDVENKLVAQECFLYSHMRNCRNFHATTTFSSLSELLRLLKFMTCVRRLSTSIWTQSAAAYNFSEGMIDNILNSLSDSRNLDSSLLTCMLQSAHAKYFEASPHVLCENSSYDSSMDELKLISSCMLFWSKLNACFVQLSTHACVDLADYAKLYFGSHCVSESLPSQGCDILATSKSLQHIVTDVQSALNAVRRSLAAEDYQQTIDLLSGLRFPQSFPPSCPVVDIFRQVVSFFEIESRMAKDVAFKTLAGDESMQIERSQGIAAEPLIPISLSQIADMANSAESCLLESVDKLEKMLFLSANPSSSLTGIVTLSDILRQWCLTSTLVRQVCESHGNVKLDVDTRKPALLSECPIVSESTLQSLSKIVLQSMKGKVAETLQKFDGLHLRSRVLAAHVDVECRVCIARILFLTLKLSDVMSADDGKKSLQEERLLSSFVLPPADLNTLSAAQRLLECASSETLSLHCQFLLKSLESVLALYNILASCSTSRFGISGDCGHESLSSLYEDCIFKKPTSKDLSNAANQLVFLSSNLEKCVLFMKHTESLDGFVLDEIENVNSTVKAESKAGAVINSAFTSLYGNIWEEIASRLQIWWRQLSLSSVDRKLELCMTFYNYNVFDVAFYNPDAFISGSKSGSIFGGGYDSVQAKARAAKLLESILAANLAIMKWVPSSDSPQPQAEDLFSFAPSDVSFAASESSSSAMKFKQKARLVRSFSMKPDTQDKLHIDAKSSRLSLAQSPRVKGFEEPTGRKSKAFVADSAKATHRSESLFLSLLSSIKGRISQAEFLLSLRQCVVDNCWNCAGNLVQPGLCVESCIQRWRKSFSSDASPRTSDASLPAIEFLTLSDELKLAELLLSFRNSIRCLLFILGVCGFYGKVGHISRCFDIAICREALIQEWPFLKKYCIFSEEDCLEAAIVHVRPLTSQLSHQFSLLQAEEASRLNIVTASQRLLSVASLCYRIRCFAKEGRWKDILETVLSLPHGDNVPCASQLTDEMNLLFWNSCHLTLNNRLQDALLANQGKVACWWHIGHTGNMAENNSMLTSSDYVTTFGRDAKKFVETCKSKSRCLTQHCSFVLSLISADGPLKIPESIQNFIESVDALLSVRQSVNEACVEKMCLECPETRFSLRSSLMECNRLLVSEKMHRDWREIAKIYPGDIFNSCSESSDGLGNLILNLSAKYDQFSALSLKFDSSPNLVLWSCRDELRCYSHLQSEISCSMQMDGLVSKYFEIEADLANQSAFASRKSVDSLILFLQSMKGGEIMTEKSWSIATSMLFIIVCDITSSLLVKSSDELDSKHVWQVLCQFKFIQRLHRSLNPTRYSAHILDSIVITVDSLYRILSLHNVWIDHPGVESLIVPSIVDWKELEYLFGNEIDFLSSESEINHHVRLPRIPSDFPIISFYSVCGCQLLCLSKKHVSSLIGSCLKKPVVVDSSVPLSIDLAVECGIAICSSADCAYLQDSLNSIISFLSQWLEFFRNRLSSSCCFASNGLFNNLESLFCKIDCHLQFLAIVSDTLEISNFLDHCSLITESVMKSLNQLCNVPSNIEGAGSHAKSYLIISLLIDKVSIMSSLRACVAKHEWFRSDSQDAQTNCVEQLLNIWNHKIVNRDLQALFVSNDVEYSQAPSWDCIRFCLDIAVAEVTNIVQDYISRKMGHLLVGGLEVLTRADCDATTLEVENLVGLIKECRNPSVLFSMRSKTSSCLTRHHYPGLVQSIWSLGIPQPFCGLLHMCQLLTLLKSIEVNKWWLVAKTLFSGDFGSQLTQYSSFDSAFNLIAQFSQRFNDAVSCSNIRRQLTLRTVGSPEFPIEEGKLQAIARMSAKARSCIDIFDFVGASLICKAASELIVSSEAEFAIIMRYDSLAGHLMLAELRMHQSKIDTEFLLCYLASIDGNAGELLQLLPSSEPVLGTAAVRLLPGLMIDKCRQWICKSDQLSIAAASFDMMRSLATISDGIKNARSVVGSNAALSVPLCRADLDEVASVSLNSLNAFDSISLIRRELRFLFDNASRYFLQLSSVNSHKIVSEFAHHMVVDQLQHEMVICISEFNESSIGTDDGKTLLLFAQALSRLACLLNQSMKLSGISSIQSKLTDLVEVAKLIIRNRTFVLRTFQSPTDSSVNELLLNEIDAAHGREEEKRSGGIDYRNIGRHRIFFMESTEQEQKIAAALLFNKTVADRLKACIRNGQCWFDSNCIIIGTETLESTTLLSEALRDVDSHPSIRSNEEVRSTIVVSEFILKLRQSVLAGNWGGIPKSFSEAISSVYHSRLAEGSDVEESTVPFILRQLNVYLSSIRIPHDRLRQEIGRISDQMENIHAKNILDCGITFGSLLNAMKMLRLPGSANWTNVVESDSEIDRSLLSVRLLLLSQDWCRNHVRNKFESTKILIEASCFISQLRCSLLDNDWASIKTLLDDLRKGFRDQLSSLDAVSKEAYDELTLFIEIEDIDSRLSRDLFDSVSTNRIRGSPAALDTSDTSVTLLNSAIVRACEFGCKSPDTKVLLHTAILVRDVRVGVLSGDHVRVTKLLTEKCNRLPSPGHQSKLGEFSSIALEEISLMQRSVDYLVWLNEVQHIFVTGGPLGEVGKLDVSSIDLPKISAALSLMKSVGVPGTVVNSERQDRTISTLMFLCNIRTAVKLNEWGAEELAKFITADIITPYLVSSDNESFGIDEFPGHTKLSIRKDTQKAVYHKPSHKVLPPVNIPLGSRNDNLLQLVLNLRMMGQAPPYQHVALVPGQIQPSSVDAAIHTDLLGLIGDGWSSYFEHKDLGGNDYFLLSSLLCKWRKKQDGVLKTSSIQCRNVSTLLAELCGETSLSADWNLSVDCVDEIRMMRDELYHRIISFKFNDALANCPLLIRSNKYGDLSDISVNSKSENLTSVRCLDEAIAVALHLGTPSPETQKLLISARLLRCVRFHVEKRNWLAICQPNASGLSLLRIAKRFFDLDLLSGLVHQELIRTFDEIQRVVICDQLLISVGKSCVQNSSGLDEIDESNSSCNTLVVSSDGLLDLRRTVTSISRNGCPPDEASNEAKNWASIDNAKRIADESIVGKGVMRLICALGEYLLRLRMAIKTGNYLAASDLSLALLPEKSASIRPLLEFLNVANTSSFSSEDENLDWLMSHGPNAIGRPLFHSVDSIISAIDKLGSVLPFPCIPIPLDDCARELKAVMGRKMVCSSDLMPLTCRSLMILAKSEASALLSVVLDLEDIKAGNIVMERMSSRMERLVDLKRSQSQNQDSLENCFYKFSTAVRATVQAIEQCGAQEVESNRAFLQSVRVRHLAALSQPTPPPVEVSKTSSLSNPTRRLSTASMLSIAPPPSIQQSVAMEKSSVFSVQQGAAVDNQSVSKSHVSHFAGHKQSSKQPFNKAVPSMQRMQSLQSQPQKAPQLPPAHLSLLCPTAGGVYCGIPVVYVSESFLSIVRQTLNFVGPNNIFSESSVAASRMHLLVTLSSIIMVLAQVIPLPASQQGQPQQAFQCAPGLSARVIEITASDTGDNDQAKGVITAVISKTVTSGSIVMLPLHIFQPLANLLEKFNDKLNYFDESFLPPDGWSFLGEFIEISVCFLVRCGRVHELIASLDLVREALNDSDLIKLVKKAATLSASKQIRVIKSFRGDYPKEVEEEKVGKFLSDTIMEEDESAEFCPDSPLMSTISRSTNHSFGFGLPLTPRGLTLRQEEARRLIN